MEPHLEPHCGFPHTGAVPGQTSAMSGVFGIAAKRAECEGSKGGRKCWRSWTQNGVRLMMKDTPGDHLTVTRLRAIGGYLARVENDC